MSGKFNFQSNLAKLRALSSFRMSNEEAASILRSNDGDVRRSLDEAERRFGVKVHPVPDMMDKDGKLVKFKNLINENNSCFMAATITACFAHWDAFDRILSRSQAHPKDTALRDDLRKIVNGLRKNKKRVPGEYVDKLRDYILPGGHQEDAREFFEELLDKLSFPMLPVVTNILHPATAQRADVLEDEHRSIMLGFREGEVEEEEEYTLWIRR